MSFTISAIYRRGDGDTFDAARYAHHLDLVRQRWGNSGLTGVEAWHGAGALDGGDAQVAAIALLHFSSAEAAQAALTGEHFAEIAGDIANFTTIAPELQLNTPL